MMDSPQMVPVEHFGMKMKSEILYLLSQHFSFDGEEYNINYAGYRIFITLGNEVFHVRNEFAMGMWFSCYAYDNDGGFAIVNHILQERKANYART